MKDPAIKLFGKEILLQENGGIPAASVGEDEKVFETGDGKQGKLIEELDTDKDSRRGNSLHLMEEDEKLHNPKDDPKTPLIMEENGNEKPPDTENESNSSDPKPLKKPDKILPCPRCNSMDTKFCYYNNYNVHQPRHFCKGCQRYWTAGGTMRNVPVGAGRRKNKNSVSHCRHITISEALQGTQTDIPNGVISFGPEAPVWKKGPTGVLQSRIFGVEKENGSDCSSGSSVITTSNSIEGGVGKASTSNCFTTQVPHLQGYPWPYPAIPNSGFYPPGYPIVVYPVPYWNYNVPGAWPVPLVPPPNGTNQTLSNPTSNSPLGKHSRELEEPEGSERTILIPKTLRIDDPDEAVKSSIWATLGIKSDSINTKGLLGAFEPKVDKNKNYVPETPSSMWANPAAMSRSLNFQEIA